MWWLQQTAARGARPLKFPQGTAQSRILPRVSGSSMGQDYCSRSIAFLNNPPSWPIPVNRAQVSHGLNWLKIHHRGTVSNELKWAKVPKMSKMKEIKSYPFIYRKQSLLLQEVLTWCSSCRSNLWLRFESVIKSEIRISKSETNPNYQNINDRNTRQLSLDIYVLNIWEFWFWICFMLRISYSEFECEALPSIAWHTHCTKQGGEPRFFFLADKIFVCDF